MATINGRQLRYELKYFITEGEYVVLRDRLLAAMPLDENAKGQSRGYHIRSLYFDDIYNTAMWEKQDGVMIRKKFRIRIYNLKDTNIKLEKKMKFDQMTAKASFSLTRPMCENILNREFESIRLGEDPVMDEFYGDMRTKLLKPVVIVDYNRVAYTFHAGNVRITFDRFLHSGQFSQDIFSNHVSTVPVLEPGLMILEVKYDNFLPPHIKGILSSIKATRSAISKYALCRRYH
jgi:hypothetical protein